MSHPAHRQLIGQGDDVIGRREPLLEETHPVPVDLGRVLPLLPDQLQDDAEGDEHDARGRDEDGAMPSDRLRGLLPARGRPRRIGSSLRNRRKSSPRSRAVA